MTTFLLKPFRALTKWFRDYEANANAKRIANLKLIQEDHDTEARDTIRKSYDIALRNGVVWITYKSMPVIPCEPSWTIDELLSNIKRTIINSQNAYLNNEKELV